MNDNGLAVVLLVSRVCSDGMEPLKAAEYWDLHRRLGGEPRVLLGRSEGEIAGSHGFGPDLAARVVRLLDRATAMAFELERLGQSGVFTLTPFDERYPERLVERLGTKAPPLLHAAGDLGLLRPGGLGVVGSRNVTEDGAEAARAAAERAARLGYALISGGARGVDQTAMSAAFEAGGAIVGVLAESLSRRLKKPDVRRAIHDGRAVMCTPYRPDAPFSAGNAMGRNKLVYALSLVTLVVASEVGKGGTWSGAVEALKIGAGRVGVWQGPGQGPGNDVLIEKGATPIPSIDDLEAVLSAPVPALASAPALDSDPATEADRAAGPAGEAEPSYSQSPLFEPAV